jgi:hypothetical protein
MKDLKHIKRFNETQENLNISDVIKRLNIRKMLCRSGDGLMSYGYSFLQIGGYKGQSFDDVKGEEVWDGDYTKLGVILDCRKGKCERITQDNLKKIIDDELNVL